MKIMIAGLGLIGGSMAKALNVAGYEVDGFDKENVLNYALNNNIIKGVATDFAQYDVVFIALPPESTIDFIQTNTFKNGAIVSDICGVKGVIEQTVYSKNRNFRYVGCHPMAGKAVSGIENSDENLFKNASMIIVENKKTDDCAVCTIKKLSLAMGFTTLIKCDSEYHDGKIAYTSQLAHIVSNAYVKSETADGYRGYTGGSFQDMTRIAGVDEKLWTKLFMLNREKVTAELSRLISNLQKYEKALKDGDEISLQELLKEGRERKNQLDLQE